MRPELRAADAAWEVANAARRWRRAGLIDARVSQEIGRRFADDRRRTRGGFRILFFLLTFNAVVAFWGFFSAVTGARPFAERTWLLNLVLSSGAAALALAGIELATSRWRLRRFGVEEGLAAAALFFLTFAAMSPLDRLGLTSKPMLAAICALLGAAAAAMAWRWALPLTGGLAATLLLFGAAASPAARWIWLGAGLALAAATWRAKRAEAVAVLHRARAAEAFAVACVAVYWSVHVAGLERGLFPWLGRSERVPGEVPHALAWAAMIVWPLALLTVGVRRRDRRALALGAIGLAATAASAVDALDLGPAWRVLAIAGASILALAVVLRRWFAAAADRTRRGFTDAALDGAGGAGVIEAAALLAALSPAPRSLDKPPPDGFEGGGGEFGGGGATSRY